MCLAIFNYTIVGPSLLDAKSTLYVRSLALGFPGTSSVAVPRCCWPWTHEHQLCVGAVPPPIVPSA
jgi:hypothetical protein